MTLAPIRSKNLYTVKETGGAGVEPANAGIKTRCLTTWRPAITAYILKFNTDPDH